jgi:hypothetical protein
MQLLFRKLKRGCAAAFNADTRRSQTNTRDHSRKSDIGPAFTPRQSGVAHFACVCRVSSQENEKSLRWRSAMRLNNSPYHWANSGRAERALAVQRLLILGTAYLSTYWLSNQLTHLRADVGATVFEWERAIPFVEWTIVPYLSIVLFFAASFFAGQRREDYRAELKTHVTRLAVVLAISLVCFALVPQRYTFERPVTTGFTGLMFDLLNAFDMPYNRAPSLHVSVLVMLWLRFTQCVYGWIRLALALWFILIGVSVLTTYQHHAIDVPAGCAAAVLAIRIARFLTSLSVSRAT